MEKKELKLFSLAKITTHEIIIEEQLENLGVVRYRYFKRYLVSQKSFTRKIVLTKIASAVIFGILPVIPLFAYFQVLDFINEGTIPIDLILFTGSVLFCIYFLLQFFNFFLMAMLNTNKIIGGKIFKWFETLPISREKLRKLVLLTIFRSSDVPLIVIAISLPIVLLIGTQNILIFFVSVVVSILNTIFSLNVLVLFSIRMSKTVDINEISSSKTHTIRLINLIFYIIIIISSIVLIQWSLSSMDSIFAWFANLSLPSVVILILSMIPFPIAPGYLLSSFISPTQIPLQIWYNIIIGFILFLILTWFVYNQAKKGIEYSTYSKFRPAKKNFLTDKLLIKASIKPPVKAYINKDLLTASRDLKSFMSMIMPIILNWFFTFAYYSTNIWGITLLDVSFIFNWLIFVNFNIIISGMIVYGLLSVESSGSAILASLPLVPREQAKAKLLLILLIQIITILTPPIMYVGSSKFLYIFLIALGTLPFILLFTFLMFELRVYLFGKTKKTFLIEEVFPKKKVLKWFFIFFIEYVVFNSVYVVELILLLTNGVITMLVFSIFILSIGFLITIVIFNLIFPINADGISKKEI
ncbi:MAG: hypothetical protein ACFE75_06070 [Candidatus Hodarchaeota archaeon]